MYYEENCQLGFSQPNKNDLFYFGQDDMDQNDSDSGHYMNAEDGIRNDKENRNFQSTEQEKEIKKLISNAALKLNFDKKVRFGEQLSFKMDNPPLFSSEEPAPIEFRNNLKSGIPKAGKSKKGKKQKNKNLFMPNIMKKQRPGSAKQKKPLPTSDFNLDTRAQKYFDVNIDPKEKRFFEKEQRNNIKRPVSGLKGDAVVSKNYEEGKFEIGFLKQNGQLGSKFEVYNNIDTLAQDKQQMNYAATGYSMKKMMKTANEQKKLVPAISPQKKRSPSKSKNQDILIAMQQTGEDNDQMFKMLRNNRGEDYQQQEYHTAAGNNGEKQLLLANNEVDLQLHQLVGKTLQQKEVMIKTLEDQLEKERLRREQMTDKFKEQIQHFEHEKDNIDKMKKASNLVQKKQHDKESYRHKSDPRMEDDLDMVPTKEKSSHRNQTERSQMSALPKKKPYAQFRPERIKSSIPKFQPANNNKSTKYIEELKKQELERAVKLQHEDEVAQQVVKKLRDNPNEQLNDLQSEVVMLNKKVEPLLRRVEEAARNIQIASGSNFRQTSGPMGMLQRMGGRMINFYSDELAERFLDDFLLETAIELQKIEKISMKEYKGEEAKHVAESLLKTLVDYQSEEQFLSMKWNNPAMKTQLNKAMALSSLQREPQPITFNLNEDLNGDLAQDQQHFASHKQLNANKDSYQNPFSKVDAFSQKLAEISSSAPDVSYNMMAKLQVPANHHSQFQDPIQLQGDKDAKYEIKRKYKVDIDPSTVSNIVAYRDQYEKFLKMHNNTSNKDVWKMYDHIADDLFHEIYNQALKNVSKDMEEYIEKVIYDEFQINT